LADRGWRFGKNVCVEAVIGRLVDYCRGMIVLSPPNFQAQVVPPPTVPSITAVMAAAIYNPNIVRCILDALRGSGAASGYPDLRAHRLRPGPLRRAVHLRGHRHHLYGCKLAIERLSGDRTMREGLREDLKIVTSEAAHYARLNIAGWLGLGIRNIVSLPTTRDKHVGRVIG
jgi:L-2,4-diaminobutyrate decarboxylase